MQRSTVLYLLAALLIYFSAAICSIGFHHPDEHFQLLEFASYKAGNPDTHKEDLPWEFSARVRPAVQVFIAYSVIKTAYYFGFNDPFGMATILRLVSATLSLFCLWLLFIVFCKEVKAEYFRKLYLILCISLFFLPYIGVRFSSETWSGALFFIAFAWSMLNTSRLHRLKFLGIGFLLGLSFDIRYQTGFMIFGFLAWMAVWNRQMKLMDWTLMAIGILLAIGIGILSDRWLYGEWTLSLWNYFRTNILEGKASSFGVSPWWWYFPETILKGAIVSGLAITVGFIYFWIKNVKHPLTWISLPFVIIHTLIPHKELRFLFPVTFIIPFLLAFLLERRELSFLLRPAILSIFIIANIPLLIFKVTTPASDSVAILRILRDESRQAPATLYYHGRNPYNDYGPSYTFYKPPGNVRFISLPKLEDLTPPAQGKILLQSKNANLHLPHILPGYKLRLLYQSIPWQITTYFNINHWVQRTNISSLYEYSAEK